MRARWYKHRKKESRKKGGDGCRILWGAPGTWGALEGDYSTFPGKMGWEKCVSAPGTEPHRGGSDTWIFPVGTVRRGIGIRGFGSPRWALGGVWFGLGWILCGFRWILDCHVLRVTLPPPGLSF